MTNTSGIITENIRNTIAPDQRVFDREGKPVGVVDMVDHRTGYFTVRVNPLSEKTLNIPFRLINAIDPRELFVSVSRAELHDDYATPPARSTFVTKVGGEEVATTTETSGYTSTPIVVERVRLDDFRRRIAVGDHVLTSEMRDLGKIKRYDPLTGWMLVERGTQQPPKPGLKPGLMIPLTIVQDVSTDTHEVFLVAAEADLERWQHLEPADVVFVEAAVNESP